MITEGYEPRAIPRPHRLHYFVLRVGTDPGRLECADGGAFRARPPEIEGLAPQRPFVYINSLLLVTRCFLLGLLPRIRSRSRAAAMPRNRHEVPEHGERDRSALNQRLGGSPSTRGVVDWAIACDELSPLE